MRNAFVVVVAAVMLAACGVRSAEAVDLTPCDKGSNRQRIECLRANIVLLNSSYQKVAAELRQSVKDLRAEMTTLRTEFDKKLAAEVAGLRKEFKDEFGKLPAPPKLEEYVRKNESFKLGFAGTDVCLSRPTGMEPYTVNTTPSSSIGMQRIAFLQDCQGGPPLNFR